jgi:diacylglycerol kinase (ATP)
VSRRRAPSLFESVNYAIEGIVHVLRTHRNMRIHFAAAIAVLVAAVWLGVTRFELIALMLAIAFVLVAEMINSAVEQAVDLATTAFDPLAKLAKDIAAGAVLISAITAVGVGYLVFSRRLGDPAEKGLDRLRNAPYTVTLVALVLVTLVVIATKAWTGRGTPLRGGLPSGHAALAFAGWMAVTYIVANDDRFLVSSIMFLLAILVAQTRVEAGFHSTLEVAYGGILGALVTLAVFQLFF